MRPSIRLLLTLAVLDPAAAAAWGQGGQSTAATPPIVRVSGGSVHRNNPLARSGPGRFRRTPSFDFRRVPQFAGMSPSGAMTLSPMRLLLPDRGSLELRRATVWGTENGGAAVLQGRGQDSSEVRFSFLAAQGKTYLVDIHAAEPCSGYPTCPSTYTAPFEVLTPNGIQTILVNMNEPHALIAFVPTADGWYEFRVSASQEWWFYGVTVTAVQ
jgi:hypothetical protein